jgi:hypothetical protein
MVCSTIQRLGSGSRDSFIHDNAWVGVWCDFCEGSMLIEDSGNGERGVFWEVSGGDVWGTTATTVVRNNIVQGNGCGSAAPHSSPGGMIANDSTDIDIYLNTFGSNCGAGAFRAIEGARYAGPLQAVFRDNILNGDAMAAAPPTSQ